MDSIVRAAIVYAVLLLLFRVAGKRSLGDISTFDAVVLLIVSEAVQQALIDGDESMTNAFLLVATLMGLQIVASVVTTRWPLADRLLSDVPVVLIEDGTMHRDRMRRSRVTEDDIMERARELRGVERMDQVRYAILERSGAISIIPRDVGFH